MSEERLWETFEEPRRERAEKAEARVAELESTLTSIAATLYCADSAELVDEALRLANSVFEKPTASVCTDQEKDSGKSNAESTDCRSFEVSQGVEEAVRGARQSRGHGRDEPLESDRGMAQAAETDQVNARARSEESTEAVRVIAEAARERLRTSDATVATQCVSPGCTLWVTTEIVCLDGHPQRTNEAKPTGLEVLKKWSEEGAADLQNMNDAHPRSETPLAWTPELYNEAFELGRNSSIEQAVNERFRALWNQTVGACVAALESADPPSAKLYAGLQYGADLLRKLAPETGSAGT